MTNARCRFELLVLVLIVLLAPAGLPTASPAEPTQPSPVQLLQSLDTTACSEQSVVGFLEPEARQNKDAFCDLSDCTDWCNEVCTPNGGQPATCSWNSFAGECRGICWCNP